MQLGLGSTDFSDICALNLIAVRPTGVYGDLLCIADAGKGKAPVHLPDGCFDLCSKAWPHALPLQEGLDVWWEGVTDGGPDFHLGLAAAGGVCDSMDGPALILCTPLSKEVLCPTVGAGIIIDAACIEGGGQHGLKLKLSCGIRDPEAWPLSDLMGEDWDEAWEVNVADLCRGWW